MSDALLRLCTDLARWIHLLTAPWEAETPEPFVAARRRGSAA